MTQDVSPLPPPPLGAKQRIVIIGGGVSGALSAFELSRAGHSVTLIEAKGLGNGSSSRSAACIRQQFGTESTVRGMIYCVRYYERWQEIVGGGRTPIVQNGYLFLYDPRSDPRMLKERVAIQRRAGLKEVRFLSRADIDSRFQYIETTDIRAATWCPTDGFLYHDLVYLDSAAAAERLGAKIVCNASVKAAERQGNRVCAVYTEDDRVFEADLFVNACGVWSPAVSGFFGGWPLDVKARRRYLYFLPGFEAGANGLLNNENFPQLPMTITPRGCYCRPESGSGRSLMMGWLHAVDPEPPAFDRQDAVESGFRHEDQSGFGMAVWKEMTRYVPDAEEMGRIQAVTTGYYDDTPDCNPLIGFDPWIENLIHVAGFSGHGLMHAPYSARIVAELAAARQNLDFIDLPFGIGPVDIRTFRVDRDFSKSPKEDMVI